jgi:quercetin dioxygenase-like cupin family protein
LKGDAVLNSQTRGAVHLGNGAGKAMWLLTDLHTLKLVGADTNGAFTVSELSAGPDFAPPPHIHHREDECFYVLEGTFDFSLAGQAFSAGAGSFVHLPKDIVHTHRAGGGRAAKALVVHSPAGIELFLEEATTPATDVSTRPAVPPPAVLEAMLPQIIAVAAKYGIEVPPA